MAPSWLLYDTGTTKHRTFGSATGMIRHEPPSIIGTASRPLARVEGFSSDPAVHFDVNTDFPAARRWGRPCTRPVSPPPFCRAAMPPAFFFLTRWRRAGRGGRASVRLMVAGGLVLMYNTGEKKKNKKEEALLFSLFASKAPLGARGLSGSKPPGGGTRRRWSP